MFIDDDVYTCHIHPAYAISLSCVTRVEKTGGSSGADFASRKGMAGTDGFPGRWFRNTCCALRVLLALVVELLQASHLPHLPRPSTATLPDGGLP